MQLLIVLRVNPKPDILLKHIQLIINEYDQEHESMRTKSQVSSFNFIITKITSETSRPTEQIKQNKGRQKIGVNDDMNSFIQ